jgi:hypothetical protein
MMEQPWCRSEEKREPVSDIDTGVVDGLKVLDPGGPIREADKRQTVSVSLLNTQERPLPVSVETQPMIVDHLWVS